jgi:LemA protein
MSITLIVVLALAAVLVLWVISVQNRLVKIDELCNNSLKQIQVQQMSRYDALKTIVSLARESAQVEGENFEKIINARKITTSPAPTAKEINENEAALSQMATRLIAVAEQYPQLQGTTQYQEAIKSYKEYEENVRLSRMTCNDTITKYNREVRSFPASIIAGLLHFPVRDYLADAPGKAEIPEEVFKR